MKDIKTFVIGFLTCACMFLIMGQTNGEKPKNYDTYLEVEKGNVTIQASENCRYQVSSVIAENTLTYGKKGMVIHTIIDTRTGNITDIVNKRP